MDSPKEIIDSAKLLKELNDMAWEKIMTTSLTGRFSGLFETFDEMEKVVKGKDGETD